MRSSRPNYDQTHARRVCSTLLTPLWIAALLMGAAATATAAPETAKGVAGSAASSEAPLLGLAEVVDELRRGGLVIYFRHAATEQAGASDETADLDSNGSRKRSRRFANRCFSCATASRLSPRPAAR